MRTAWRVPPQSDLTRWRLDCERGRHTWRYTADSSVSQTFFESYCLGLIGRKSPGASRTPDEAVRAAAGFYCKLQGPDGHWPGDYGGPLFLLPGLLIVSHVCSVSLVREERDEMIRYLRNCQSPDGGWGLHTRDKSTMFGTVLNYVSLRILGSLRPLGTV